MELPNHLIDIILAQAELPIDTRLALKIAPKRVEVTDTLCGRLNKHIKRRYRNYMEYARTSTTDFLWAYPIDVMLSSCADGQNMYIEIKVLDTEGTVHMNIRSFFFKFGCGHRTFSDNTYDVHTGEKVD
jgi:hypothetical protein